MASKRVGLGATVSVDPAGGTTYTVCTLPTEITPPPRTRVLVDQQVLADVLATNAAGIEDHSEFNFMKFWHPGDTQHETLDTLFGNSNEARWKITYPFSTPVLDSFLGWVSGLEPEAIVSDQIIGRRVTIQRTGATTRA